METIELNEPIYCSNLNGPKGERQTKSLATKIKDKVFDEKHMRSIQIASDRMSLLGSRKWQLPFNSSS